MSSVVNSTCTAAFETKGGHCSFFAYASHSSFLLPVMDLVISTTMTSDTNKHIAETQRATAAVSVVSRSLRCGWHCLLNRPSSHHYASP